jgi:hypothetical protein
MRFYDPSTARLVSEDPIGFAGGLNRFAYVGNNPLQFSDPLGLGSRRTTRQEANVAFTTGGIFFDSTVIAITLVWPGMSSSAQILFYVMGLLEFDLPVLYTSDPGLNRFESQAASVCSATSLLLFSVPELSIPIALTGVTLNLLSMVDPSTQARYGRWASWPVFPWLWLLNTYHSNLDPAMNGTTLCDVGCM